MEGKVTNLRRNVAVCFGLLALAVVLIRPASAQQVERNILTGGPTGTYIQIGQDMSRLAADCGIQYKVQESAGSLENFLGVRKRPQTQFGIVQSDVLEYLKTYSADDPAIARAIFGVRIAFPLYNEEVHILAKREIGSLSELNGKRVAVGVEDSGTFLTASLVLDLAEVQPAERLKIDADTSLAQLTEGSIDAFFYVAGAPTKLFQSPEIDGTKLHFLPIDNPTLAQVYVPSRIEAGTYPFQSEAIDVVAVKAVLMTYEYVPSRNSYHRASCEAVSDLANLVFTNFQKLRDTGHPKWQNVDLNDIPPGWDIASCVNEGLSESYQLECAMAPAAPAVVTNESQANAAYRERICAQIGC